MKYKKLTPSQLNIMKTLWDKKEPMIASDFVQLDPSLNLNSVQCKEVTKYTSGS